MKIFEKIILVFAAIIITFALFIAIPIVHKMFGFSLDIPKGLTQKPQVLIEKIPPQKKEEKKAEQRIRQMKSASMDRAMAGAAKSMSMKFTPDLSVEGSANGAAVSLQGQDLQAEIFEEGQTDEAFVPVYNPPVEYPERARELGVQGTLEVVFVIDIDGKVTSLEIRKSPHPTIATEARKTISSWKFKPARNKGVPVKVRVRQEIEFKLE
jgi:periplasmic protein TonB